MIQVKNLSRSYGDFVAVDEVSFEISQGEIVGLLGHNGAGKSTIMKMLTGFLEPSRGMLRIGGQLLGDDPRQAQQRIGYLPENCPLYPEMSIIEFLDYSAALRGLNEAQRDRAIMRAMSATELHSKGAAPIATLSRGYRQRVGVAQALLHQPQILILDEPTNGLDPEQIGHMRDLIRTLGQETTVIVSTHILQEVAAVCDRVLILKQGRLALDAQLADLTRGQALLLHCSAGAQDGLELFGRMAQIADVELLHADQQGSRYRLIASGDGSADNNLLAPLAAQLVVAQGWQLYELRREERTLEKVFHEIMNQADVEVPHAA